MKRIGVVILLLLVGALAVYLSTSTTSAPPAVRQASPTKAPDLSGLSVATLAGGCFWCVEAAFEEVPGVYNVVSGYSGGDIKNPTYKQVSAGLTKHTEAVQFYYDPKVITFEGLLQVLWRTADPTDSKGQYHDRGSQYRPAIFYHNEQQRLAAIRSRGELSKSGPFKKPITIEIVDFKSFYSAEDYHQDYHRKKPLHYVLYTIGSGRTAFHEEVWGDKLKIDFSKYRPGKKANVRGTQLMTGM